MVIHETPKPRDHPPQYIAPPVALGALIAEAGDPCSRCTNCREMFLLSTDGYHSHLCGDNKEFLLANDCYNYLDGGVLYDWAPVTDCPNCHQPLYIVAGPTYYWGEKAPDRDYM
jgi:hypothetical protein